MGVEDCIAQSLLSAGFPSIRPCSRLALDCVTVGILAGLQATSGARSLPGR